FTRIAIGGEVVVKLGRDRLLDKYFVLLVEGSKILRESRNTFGISEEKEARRLESIVQDRHDFSLQLGPQIDQKVAAGDHVHPRKRRGVWRALLSRAATTP